jgi:hypothetical protein
MTRLCCDAQTNLKRRYGSGSIELGGLAAEPVRTLIAVCGARVALLSGEQLTERLLRVCHQAIVR